MKQRDLLLSAASLIWCLFCQVFDANASDDQAESEDSVEGGFGCGHPLQLSRSDAHDVHKWILEWSLS